MPGFIVQGEGSGKPDDFQPYYSYTWSVDQIFGKDVSRKGGILLEACVLPSFSVNVDRVTSSSVVYKYASEVNWEDCKLTFYDTVGLLPLILEWRKKVWSAAKGLGVASKYKSDSVITQFTDTWESPEEFKLKNSWPSYIRYGDLTYVNSTPKVVDVTITYDWLHEGEEATDSGTQEKEKKSPPSKDALSQQPGPSSTPNALSNSGGGSDNVSQNGRNLAGQRAAARGGSI